ncbi:TIGR03118 family protein [Nonomuraea sp. NPDC050556]|uniref:TIGR03118 family protein n=1 Tax=Nonomuraea sp. NPDC050556 TaxID=3364369 RepID=UPI00378D88D4
MIIRLLCAVALVGATLTTTAPAQAAQRVTRFTEVDLVSDIPGRAAITDKHLVNPWGMSMGPRLWVSDADADVSTVYSDAVRKEPLEVVVAGGPTGQVFNPGPRFRLDGRHPALFMFATESGTIAGWNPAADATRAIVKARVHDASFKGLALLRGRFLLAADFFHARVDVFDSHFRRLRTHGAFRDRGLPGGYAPFNVAVVGGSVFVAYALQNDDRDEEVAGPGNGFVTQFSSSGRFLRRFVSRGPLNAPWAITVAPAGFGTFAGALLVGNFGDGRINAFDRHGRFLGPLRKQGGAALEIEGLWGLLPGTQANGGRDALWFAAGIDDEQHGLLGLIRPAS